MPSSSLPIFEVPTTLISCSTLISSHAPSSSCILLHMPPHLVHITLISCTLISCSEMYSTGISRFPSPSSHAVPAKSIGYHFCISSHSYHCPIGPSLSRGEWISSHCSLCHLQHTPALYYFDHTTKLWLRFLVDLIKRTPQSIIYLWRLFTVIHLCSFLLVKPKYMFELIQLYPSALLQTVANDCWPLNNL